jgi:hypothetical protein
MSTKRIPKIQIIVLKQRNNICITKLWRDHVVPTRADMIIIFEAKGRIWLFSNTLEGMTILSVESLVVHVI